MGLNKDRLKSVTGGTVANLVADPVQENTRKESKQIVVTKKMLNIRV